MCQHVLCYNLATGQIFLSSASCHGLTHNAEHECLPFFFVDISGFLYLTILDFLICKWRIFAQDTWIPNACPLRRGQINVNSNVSYKQTKRVDKETCKSQRAQNYLQNTRSDHQPPQSMLRGAFAWPLKAPFTVSIKKKI